MTTESVAKFEEATTAELNSAYGMDLTIAGMKTISTVNGEILCINTDYVSPRVLDIIKWFYDNKVIGGFQGLYTIIFRMDGLPVVDAENDEPTAWMFFPDTMTAVCNIRGCIDVALFEAMSGDIPEASCINTWAVIWRAIVQNFFHEAHHAKAFLINRDLLDTKGQKGSLARDEEEQDAIKYAQKMMIEAAKAINIEPEFTPQLAEIINERITDEIVDIETDRSAEGVESPKHHIEWAKNMKYMGKHGFVFHAEADEGYAPKSYSTLKELMHAMSGDAENDKAWVTTDPATTCIGIPVDTSSVNPIAETTIPQTGGFMSPQTNGYVIADADFDESDFSDDGIDYTNSVSAANHVGPTTIQAPPQTQYQTPAANGMQGAANVANGQTGPNTVTNPVQGPPQQNSSPAIVDNGQTLAPLGWDPAFHQSVISSLYQKLATSIYQKCVFHVAPNQEVNTPFFEKVYDITKPVELTPEEAQLVISQSITGHEGNWLKDQPVVNNTISGCIIGKAKMLPGYELVLNNGQGGTVRRKLLPQNPWKKSKTAGEAKNGAQIVWVIDPDTNDKRKCIRVYNNVVQSNSLTANPNEWTNV